MKSMWQRIDAIHLDSNKKNIIFIVAMTVKDLLLGAIAWLLLGRMFLSGVEWMLCFMGYPAIFGGVIGSVVYLYNNEFS